MDIKDIITLSDKGFTPEQIMTLAGMPAAETPAAADPVEIPAEEPAPVEPQPAEQPSASPSYTDVMKEIARLKAMMIQQNISQTEMSSPQTETVSDILASLINGKAK